jgi:hypothetical protein
MDDKEKHFSHYPFHNLRQEIKAIGSELSINEMGKSTALL